jgi:hypothetical protein
MRIGGMDSDRTQRRHVRDKAVIDHLADKASSLPADAPIPTTSPLILADAAIIWAPLSFRSPSSDWAM